MKFVNATGKAPDRKTTPADVKQCQSFPNMLTWSFMSLGPKPMPVRCTGKPICVAVENKPGEDKLIGSMSLCADCHALFIKHFGVKHAKVTPLGRRKR